MNRKDYELLTEQFFSLAENETHSIALLSNTSALLKEFYQERVNWVGFYLMENEDLILGPFQGKVACVTLKAHTGVCQKAVDLKSNLCVTNVFNIKDHIACDSASRSEIVIPIFKNNTIIGVIDIDSANYDGFSHLDFEFLKRIADELSNKI